MRQNVSLLFTTLASISSPKYLGNVCTTLNHPHLALARSAPKPGMTPGSLLSFTP